MSHVELQTSRLRLRTGRPSDLTTLSAMLREPEVARYWPNYDEARVSEELLTADDEKQVLIIETREGQEIVGVIQYSENDNPEYRHAGIDLFLGTRWHGQGLGSEAIHAIVNHLFHTLKHHRITIDPAAHNQRAIRVYERIGFRRVGLLRQYERSPDGTFHDGLLLELLQSDHRDTGKATTEPQEVPSCTLRTATLGDVQALLEMMVAFNAHEGIAWNKDNGEAPLRHLLCDDNLGFVALFLTPSLSVAGYAVVTFGYDLEFGGRDAFLTEFFLLPRLRGKGIGRRALGLLLDEARASGVQALHLQVRAENIAAQRLYLDAGFEPTTRIYLSKLLSREDASSITPPNSHA